MMMMIGGGENNCVRFVCDNMCEECVRRFFLCVYNFGCRVEDEDEPFLYIYEKKNGMEV